MDVGPCQPVHHVVELRHHVFVVEDIARDRAIGRPHLDAAHLVAPAVDRVEQALGEVDPCAEELHLLAQPHPRNAAGDAVVVAELRQHQIVVLVLERRRGGAGGDAVALEGLREILRPENGQIGLGCRPEVGEGVQHAETRSRDEGASVERHAADALRRPVGIAREQRIVVGCAHEADDAQLDHELVHEFLRFGFAQRLLGEITLNVDVEEGRDAAHRHRGAVHLLDGAKIAEVGPLHGLAGVRRRTADVATVGRRHGLQVGKCAQLVGHLFAQPHHFLRRPARVDLGALGLLGLDQAVDAVQRNAPVVADDAPTPVGVGQAGDDAGAPAFPDLRRVHVENCSVMRLAVLGEGFAHRGVGLAADRLQPGLDHAPAAGGHDRPAERLVGLQADDHFVVPVDVARPVRSQRRGGGDVDVENALLGLFAEVGLEFVPHGERALGGCDEEFGSAGVRCHVRHDEVADVDLALPVGTRKASPCVWRLRTFHDRSPFVSLASCHPWLAQRALLSILRHEVLTL